MSFRAASQMSAYFSIGILVFSVLLCIFYYLSAKRTKTFTLGNSRTLNEIYEIIKAIPSNVFNHKVKKIEFVENNAIRLDCTTVKIFIKLNANEAKCTYKLNGFINLIFTLAFGFFGVAGVGSLLQGGSTDSIAAIAIAVVVHIIRGIVLKRGRKIVTSIEEHLR